MTRSDHFVTHSLEGGNPEKIMRWWERSHLKEGLTFFPFCVPPFNGIDICESSNGDLRNKGTKKNIIIVRLKLFLHFSFAGVFKNRYICNGKL